MNLTDVKPLQPINHGYILLVGIKASNLDEELRNHPRIIMWESQNQHWEKKDVPHNTRAIFVTRFIGHVAFGKILKEARKKRITIFNPEGTGMIIRQVRELLDMRKTMTTEETVVTTLPETKPRTKTGGKIVPKLIVLHPFVDFSKGPMDNARQLMVKANELGIETTLGSLAQMVSVLRRKKTNAPKVPRNRGGIQTKSQVDVSVEMLDTVIGELKDLRDYLVATVKENNSLKQRIEKFKRVLDND